LRVSTPAASNPLSSPEPWNLVAADYVDIAMPLLGLFGEVAIERAAIGPTARVVDVATGPGTVACRAAARAASVDAIDFSAEMVARCRARAGALGLRNVTVVEGDGQALPYADASFDLGFSMFGLMFFPDRLRGFGELCRVLRPGGRAFVTSWSSVEESPLMLARIAAWRAADPNAPSPQKNVLTLEDPRLFAREMGKAGFVDVAVEPVYRDREFRDLDDLCKGTTRGNAPFELVRREIGEQEWTRRMRIVRDYLGEHYGPFPLRLGSTAYLGQGRKPGQPWVGVLAE
jgi:ubiquinone/menaquinone biosynthesis C-methylase UbiE